MNMLDNLEETLAGIRAIARGSAFEASLAELNTTLVALLARLEDADKDPAEIAAHQRKLDAVEGTTKALQGLLAIAEAKRAEDMACEPEERRARQRTAAALEMMADAMKNQPAPQVKVQIDTAALAAAIVQGLRQQQAGSVTAIKTTSPKGETIFRIERTAA